LEVVQGLPKFTPKSEFPNLQIQLTSGDDANLIPILQREYDEPHKTLGVLMTPTGSDTAQMEALRNEANKVASVMSSSRLSKTEAMLAYQACWIPAVGYSLSTTTMSDKHLRSIQAQATSSFLQKLGFNKHFPRPVAFGPRELGGLELRDLSVEQGISQVISLMQHLYHDTVTGQLIRISMDTAQMEAGTAGLLLYETTTPLSYLTKCWIRSRICKEASVANTNPQRLEPFITSYW
jgi:hypothetical protein